jgi:hypothetical protein
MSEHLTAAIRQAVAAGDFPRVMNLWAEYAGQLQNAISRGICTPAQMAEAQQLVEWSRRTVTLARAHMQLRLNALQVAQQYRQSIPRSATLLRTCL